MFIQLDKGGSSIAIYIVRRKKYKIINYKIGCYKLKRFLSDKRRDLPKAAICLFRASPYGYGF